MSGNPLSPVDKIMRWTNKGDKGLTLDRLNALKEVTGIASNVEMLRFCVKRTYDEFVKGEQK
jgi:hypothetical protein